MTSISAALIVKNEERFLAGCLASLRGQVDEVVVADTGSTDSTVAIARENGATLIHIPWNGNFAEARNAALDCCRSDWILYIDADERLALDPGQALAALINAQGWAGATLKFRPKSGFTRYWEHRLFRRDAAIRFEGRIHETHLPSLHRFAESRGLGIGRVDARIDHFGYDGDQSHKHPRNLPLLLQAVASTPQRAYYWYHLAETYAALGRPKEALEAGERGLARAAAAESDKQAADLNLIAQTVARLMIESGRDPSDVIGQALARCPEDHATAFLKARWLVSTGACREALPILERLLAIDPLTLEPGLLAFDERIFGSFARELKAAALVKLGDVTAAGKLLRRPAVAKV